MGKGCYWDEHELVHTTIEEVITYPKWEWADLDGNRLVWVANGKLLCAQITNSGLADEKELYDFNDMEFVPVAAPY